MADEYIELAVTTEEATLADAAIDRLQTKWPDWEPNDGDLELVILETIAAMAADAAATAAAVPAEIFHSFGEDLVGVQVNPGGYATVTLVFTLTDEAVITGMTVPEGTEVDVDGYAFATDAPESSAPGAPTITAAATATELGVEFNGLSGQSVQPISSLTGIESIAVSAPSGGGADPETDEAYLDRLTQAMEVRGITLVVERDYELMALTEAGVAKVVATHLGARAVRVVGIDADGQNLTTATKDRLTQLYAAYRMVNTTVTLEDPVRTTVNVTYAAKVYPGYDIPTVEAEIDAALSGLLSPANWGAVSSGGEGGEARWYNEPRVRAYKLIDEIGDVPGVNYVSTITLSASGVTPESNGDLILPGNVPLPEPGSMVGTVT